MIAYFKMYMSRFIISTLITVFVLGIFAVPKSERVQAQQNDGPLLLAPLPGTLSSGSAQGGTARATLRTYLPAAFRIAIGLSALLAVIMIVVGGLQYMLSAGGGGKAQGKERIWAAIWGLLLVLAAWLILSLINPNLVSFNLNIGTTNVSNTSSGNTGQSPGGGNGSNTNTPPPTNPGGTCNSIEEAPPTNARYCGGPTGGCRRTPNNISCSSLRPQSFPNRRACWIALGLCTPGSGSPDSQSSGNTSGGGATPPPPPSNAPPPIVDQNAN